MNLNIISAGAGSGKTYRLTHELVDLLKGDIRASGIIATTFTKKAAAELKERVRIKLLEKGMFKEADEVSSALIGTVHSLGVRLLRRFSFEMGVSPQVDIIADEDHQVFFNQSLSTVLKEERVQEIERLVARFNLTEGGYEWRSDLRQLIEIARTNGFDVEKIQQSRDRSISEFLRFLPDISERPGAEWDQELADRIQFTAQQLSASGDETKVTRTAIDQLQQLQWEWQRRGEWAWHHWARLGKLNVAVKSKSLVEELIAFARTHEAHPSFREEWQCYVTHLFDLAIEAVAEYDRFKKERGLIDYTDMEVLVSNMLERSEVKAILAEELDLLMVDEFQDTSPIQLDIFLKLSRLVKMAIWVGDPKQSIYGFRGAEPRLMKSIIDKTGGIKPENIQRKSWRSRPDLVHLSNALFTRAFPDLPQDQVALQPARTEEPIEAGNALLHWYIDYDGEKRVPGKSWFTRALAELVFLRLQEGFMIQPKGENNWRRAQASDIAILCRTNKNAAAVAQALHEAGLKAGISRAGLMNTAEARLLNACLRFLLSDEDSLAIAELLLLASNWPLEEIVEDRFNYLDQENAGNKTNLWGIKDEFIARTEALKIRVADLSAAEIVNLVLDELQIRPIVAKMGKVEQRMANLEEFRQLAIQYEDSCQRLHTAASLGGFLLWLNRLEAQGDDQQGVGNSVDAIQVLTYHKSKGLEWPIVICHDLDQSVRISPWGMSVLPESDHLDLDQVLANRWIRYWVNPYGKQVSRTPLMERLEESPVMENLKRQALEEECRLLYVGITRARDYLVIPQKVKQPTRWLNRVFQQGEEDVPTLDHQSPESPFEWENRLIGKETRWEFFGRDIGQRAPAREKANLLQKPVGRVAFPALTLEPSNLPAGLAYQLQRTTQTEYGQSPLESDLLSDFPLLKVINAFLTAFDPSYSDDILLEMAKQLLKHFDRQEEHALAIISIGKNWNQFVQKTFAPKQNIRKQRVQFQEGQQLFRGIIDQAFECQNDWILVQNAQKLAADISFLRSAEQEAGQLWLRYLAWKRTFPQKNIRTFIHYPLSCLVVELTLNGLSVQTTLDL